MALIGKGPDQDHALRDDRSWMHVNVKSNP